MMQPVLSIIVIVYDMARQALNTVASLCPPYQQGVDGSEYEIIVVENRSPRLMDEAATLALGENVRYFLRDETGVSPAPAINFALKQARGKHIGMMVDGARMVTPGVVKYVLDAFRIQPNALVVVPGYHLGHKEQQLHGDDYNEDTEARLLESINWTQEGYRLFDICVLSGANPNGFFHPFMECNCMFAASQFFDDIGGADERFNLPGGGSINLYMYYRLAMHPDTESWMLIGEGSFHQIHGGVTTSAREDRDAIIISFKDQLNEILGVPFTSPIIEHTFFGKIKPEAYRFMQYSTERGQSRFERMKKLGKPMFPDDLIRKDALKAKRPQHKDSSQ